MHKNITQFIFLTLPDDLLNRFSIKPNVKIPILKEFVPDIENKKDLLEILVKSIYAYKMSFPNCKDYDKFLKNYFYYTGIKQANNNDLNSAFDNLNSAYQIDPDDIQLLLDLANISFDKKNYKDSIRYAKELIEKGEESVEINNLLSKSYLLDGDKQKAIEIAEKSAQKFTKDINAIDNLTTIYFHTGEYSKLESKLYEQLNMNPNEPRTLEKMGAYFRLCSRFSEAELFLKKALEFEPFNTELMYELALTYFHQNKMNEARDIITQASVIEPKNENYKMLLSQIDNAEHKQDD